MDPEEKQELKKNDLESFLYYRLPHYLKQYGAYILLVFALMFLGWQLWRREQVKQDTHHDEGSIRLSEARNASIRAFERSITGTPADPVKLYGDILTDFKDVKSVSADARLSLANFYNMMIVTGRTEVAGNTLSKDEAIAKARSEFETVVSEFSEFPTRVVAARLGLAALLESESKFAEAKKIYEEISADGGPWAGTVYASEAKKKIKMQELITGKPHIAADPVEQRMLPIGPSPASGFIPGTNVPLAPLLGPEAPTSVLPKFGSGNSPSILSGLLGTPPEKPAATLPGIGGEVVPLTTQPGKP